jgi:hypothetical protein
MQPMIGSRRQHGLVAGRSDRAFSRESKWRGNAEGLGSALPPFLGAHVPAVHAWHTSPRIKRAFSGTIGDFFRFMESGPTTGRDFLCRGAVAGQ